MQKFDFGLIFWYNNYTKVKERLFMNDFEAELLELIMDTIREDKDQKETFLRRDLDIIIRRHMAVHDEEVMERAKDMLDQDEIYDEGYNDGYANGWNDAKQEILDTVNEVYRKK